MDSAVKEAEEAIKDHCKKVARTLWKWDGKLEVSMKPLGAGKNFLSDAYFGTVKHFDFKNGEQSKKIFIKVPPASDPTKKFLFDALSTDLKPFEREYVFYTILGEKYKELCNENKEDAKELTGYISDSFTLPGELKLERALTEPMLLEDLGDSGYKMWEDEFNGFDLAHTMKVMETMGKHHALGMVFVERMQSFKNEIYNELLFPDFDVLFTDDLCKIMQNATQFFVDWMNENKFDSGSTKKLQHLADNIKSEYKILYDDYKDLQPQSFTHGDCRANNFMFKYATDGKTPIGVKIIDFQGWFKCFPCAELSYFLFSSASAEILTSNFDTIFSAYYTSMAGVLARLNYPKQRPSLAEIKALFMKTAFAGCLQTCNMLNIVFGGNPDLSKELKDKRIANLLNTAKYFDII